MGIRADFTSGGKTNRNVYLRVDRIWGSKVEGWSAWVGVYANPLDVERIDQFSASVDFESGKDPYPALYEKIRTFNFLANVKDDFDSVSKVNQVILPVAAVVIPKTESSIFDEVTLPPVAKKKSEKEIVKEIETLHVPKAATIAKKFIDKVRKKK